MAPNYRVAPKPTAPIISPSGGPAFLRSPLLVAPKVEETHSCDDSVRRGDHNMFGVYRARVTLRVIDGAQALGPSEIDRSSCLCQRWSRIPSPKSFFHRG